MKNKFVNIGNGSIIVNQKNILAALSYGKTIVIWYGSNVSVSSHEKYHHSETDDVVENKLKQWITNGENIKNYVVVSAKYLGKKITFYVSKKIRIAYFDIDSGSKPHIVLQNGGFMYLPNPLDWSVTRTIFKRISQAI